MSIIDVEGAAARMRRGEFVIIVDDAERENEGDLAIAADMVTPEMVNFMVRHARGLVCVPLLGERLDELGIPMMAQKNTSPLSTAFTESVDAKAGVTTGISAGDRAATIRALVHPETRSGDLMRPGHMFPLRYKDGGVLVRTGHTEAVIDLARAAGLYPAGVICEIMNEDGTMARMPQLEVLSAKWDIPIITIAQIIEYRRQRETMVERKGVADLPTQHGVFRAYGYASAIDAKEHVALVMGDITSDEPVLTRVHSECVTGDVFSSMRCDCGEQLDLALEHIAAEGSGVFLYMRQEGRGVGLHNKLRAYALQDTGLDTVEANVQIGFPPDLRDYGIGAQILVDLGVRKLKLMTNNPRKVVGLDAFGLELVERVPIEVQPNDHNRRYLQTKRDKMGHILTGVETASEDESTVDTEQQS